MQFQTVSFDWSDYRIPRMGWDGPQWFAALVNQVTNGRGKVRPIVAPPKTGYTEGLEADIAIAGGRLTMLSKHPKSPGVSLVSATGQAAAAVDPLVRLLGQNGHRADTETGEQITHPIGCNRRDAALDFTCTEAEFDALLALGERVCIEHGKRFFPMGEAVHGRTLYFNYKRADGLAKSKNAGLPLVQARLYEKGKQLGQNPEWRRFEVIARPDKQAAKERLFLETPEQVLCSSPWSRAFLAGIGYKGERLGNRAAIGGDPHELESVRVAKLMHTIGHMGEQYGNSVRELVGLVGEEEARRIVLEALFSPDRGGPSKIKRQARRLYAETFVPGLRGQEECTESRSPGFGHC